MGDLTFLHDLTGLVLGEGEPVPDLTVVVPDNDGGGIFAQLEPGEDRHARDYRRVFGTPHGRDLVAVAQALGWAATRVTSAASCGGARARRAARGRRPHRPAAARELHARLRAAARRPRRCPSPRRAAAQRMRPPLRRADGTVMSSAVQPARARVGGHRRGCPQPSSAAWKAANFDWVSASSAAGSEPATMPQPANSRALSSPTSSAQRSARPNSPSPRASSQPTGPA